jgi:hypothetical protein
MANLKTRTDEAVKTLAALQLALGERMAHVGGIQPVELDWPIRIFKLLQRMSEGDKIAEEDLRRELEPWNWNY